MNLTQILSHITDSLPILWAEYSLIFSILIMIVAMLIFSEKKFIIGSFIGILSLIIAIFITLRNPMNGTFFMDMLQMSPSIANVKILIFLAGIAAFLYQIFLPKNKENTPVGEWFPLILTLLFGASLMVMAANLLMMYIATEIVSISSYLLAALRKNNPQSAEAGIKYTLFGAFASAIMIYGISWFYGCTGTLDISHIEWVNSFQALPDFTQTMVWLLIFTGFLFKINAVPLHFWTPDVYEGTDFGTAALFSVVPKVAAMMMWLNLLSKIDLSPTLLSVLLILAMLSITLGNVAAIGQNNIKRLLAYSSIAHSGFILMAFLTQSAYSEKALLFYLEVYTCMNLVVFFATGFISAQINSENINDYQGISKHFSFITVCLVILMFSLTGLPPTAGFIAKWYVFLAIWEKWANTQSLIWLIALVIAVVNTVISLSYYMKIPAMMVFRPLHIEISTPKSAIGMYLLIGIMTALMVIGGIYVF